jgi:hypothetical protein
MELNINYLPFNVMKADVENTKNEVDYISSFTYAVDREPKSPVEYYNLPVDEIGKIWEDR